MVTPTLSSQRSLANRGYSNVEFTYGWEDHAIQLYTHRDLGHKRPGEKSIKARVENPRSLTTAEADYIARKGAQGHFMWKPEDCMKHEFTHIELVARPGGGVVQRRGEKTHGCKWCRDRQNTGLERGAGESDQPLAESAVSEAQTPAPSPVTLTQSGAFACEDEGCGFVAAASSKAGKPRSDKQRAHALVMHIKRVHSAG